MISITINGNPKPQARPRFVKRNSFVTVYDKSKQDKKDFLTETDEVSPLEPFESPTSVEIVFAFKRPKAHYGSGRNANKLKPSAPKFHTKKPDIDNLQKFVFDALNGVFWKDDSYIDEVVARKCWSEVGEGYTSVKITEPGDNL
jgi:Holliday junction resolvase RusA-like endonuclease